MTIKLLLSTSTRERLEKQINAIAKRHNNTILYVDESSREFEMAFISREITGLSTKHKVLPATQAFYDALLQSRTLHWVHIHAAGVDRPVYQKLLARGVQVTPSTGTNAKEVAQSALGGLLALARKFPQFAQAQRRHVWAPTFGVDLPRQLAGQTVLIVGWGAIGQQLAKYLSMLELNIVVVRHKVLSKAEEYETVDYKSINAVLPRANWVVLCCPLTDATRHLISSEQLSLMPRHSHLINVSRGEVIDEPMLENALLQGRIAGAFLDVFAYEPLSPSSRLWDIDNVIITPHNAGFSDANGERVDDIFLQQLESRLA
jgi:D-2-hydroxyacid dehydrogenase (NADP+)